MRTSATQFEMLVDFMARNGDLSKPMEGPHGRVSNIQRWTELTNMLNADSTGDTKTSEKWRKVWSDMKNNAKRKAARLNRATIGTGGGPASRIRLTDLEQRILDMIGTQTATGIVEVAEVGLEETVGDVGMEQMPSVLATSQPTSQQTPSSPRSAQLITFDIPLEMWNYPGSSLQATPSADVVPEPHIQGGPTFTPHNEIHSPHPTQSAPPPPPPPPPPAPVTPRRRRRILHSETASPIRRRTRPATQSDAARQAFLNADREWRTYQMDKERERIRIREIELRQQDRWQDLFQQFLNIVQNIANRFSNNIQN